MGVRAAVGQDHAARERQHAHLLRLFEAIVLAILILQGGRARPGGWSRPLSRLVVSPALRFTVVHSPLEVAPTWRQTEQTNWEGS
ncbi:hypothetical protein EI42_06355 [Thermosporothrix hazakensis]|jgi:hypothetical protein|uniref:Uncharacterized protein n=1 Tax=Thermosporothrix hazakensis TaxID=644383 RepID=A0A326TRD5_THEHA|nr:hypothetical protein EI42_06355 [Thermosporothrix hazakensis]